MHEFVKSFALNEAGRDFVVGDIHGCFHLLENALTRVGFSRSVDRLFALGDLVDRGPFSDAASQYLNQEWFISTCGNHEDLFLSLYARSDDLENRIKEACSRNGMGWWLDVSESDREDFLRRIMTLPLAIEVQTSIGMVGLVHADVPYLMDWQTFTNKLRSSDAKTQHCALWSQERIKRVESSGVAGIERVFVGHSTVQSPWVLGNVLFIDTGAVVGERPGAKVPGHLTIVQLDAEAAAIDKSRPVDFINAVLVEAPSL